MKSKEGKLLVAHPNLPKDNWFHKTVIYIYLDNEKDGTIGVTLNVATSLTIQKLCYGRGILFPDSSKPVFKGGPVADKTVVMLHTAEWQSTSTAPAGPGYAITSSDRMFEDLAIGREPAYWRTFLGVSAWQPGQLDLEMEGQYPYRSENSWLTCDANDSIMFDYNGEKQWEKALDLCSQQMIDYYF